MRSRNHFAAKTATHYMRVTVQLQATVNCIYVLSDAQQSLFGKFISPTTMQIISNRISMFHRAFFDLIIDEYQHMHFFTFNTVLV